MRVSDWVARPGAIERSTVSSNWASSVFHAVPVTDLTLPPHRLQGGGSSSVVVAVRRCSGTTEPRLLRRPKLEDTY